MCVLIRYCLQSDIMDVNQIFADLGQLVHEQGETIGECYSHVISGCRSYMWLNR